MTFNPDDLAGYHAFRSEDGEEYGSFEVFHVGPGDDSGLAPGWYWFACWPGCMPDGEAEGPYETALEAYAEAQAI